MDGCSGNSYRSRCRVPGSRPAAGGFRRGDASIQFLAARRLCRGAGQQPPGLRSLAGWRRLAFTALKASGIFQAFLRDLNALESRPVPNGMGAYQVFWPPDGRSLFLTVGGSVRRYALEGDSYQVLCDTTTIMLTGALVGPNLMISARSANFTVPLSGGTPQVTKEFYPWPRVLPDGRHLLYTSFDAKSGHHRARVVELGKPDTARDLLETDSRTEYAPSLVKPGTGYLVYVKAGNLLAHPFDPRSLRIEGEPLPIAFQIYWVWLLWNDGPGWVEAALVLLDVELPVGIEVS